MNCCTGSNITKRVVQDYIWNEVAAWKPLNLSVALFERCKVCEVERIVTPDPLEIEMAAVLYTLYTLAPDEGLSPQLFRDVSHLVTSSDAPIASLLGCSQEELNDMYERGAAPSVAALYRTFYAGVYWGDDGAQEGTFAEAPEPVRDFLRSYYSHH